MKERPILFSGEMVKAILDGRKTQTRRAVKPQPLQDVDGDEEITWEEKPIETGWESEIGTEPCFAHWQLMRPGKLQPAKILCPYGVVGDRLWVKESWRTGSRLDGLDAAGITNAAEDASCQPGKGESWGKYKPCPIVYEADGKHLVWADNDFAEHNFGPIGRLRVPRFMPRWASRITLEITGVRVERLQDITDQDAESEGIQDHPQITSRWMDYETGDESSCPIHSYRTLWEKINGHGSWDANPYVWVIEFKKI